MKRLLFALALGLVPTGALHAQRNKAQDPIQQDPYTLKDPSAMQAVGYMAMGEMPWANGHTTTDIEKALGGVHFIWIETEHFRIGSSLPTYTIDSGNPVERKKIRSELKRLNQRLASVPRKTKTLDPWLRLHLYAMRAEDLYAQTCDLLKVSDDDFPQGYHPGTIQKIQNLGPYLGMRDKFTLLLTEKKSTLARYGSGFCGIKTDAPISFHFEQSGVQFFGLAAEMDNMGIDTTMHCMVVFGLSLNLIHGYLAFRHRMPTWLSVGIAHWCARQIDAKRNYFSSQRTFTRDDKNIWDWEVRVHGRVKNDADPSFFQMASWPNQQSLSFSDIMVSWSRVDYLYQMHPQEFAQILRVIKTPFPPGTMPSAETLQTRQIDAFQTILNFSPEEFDTSWRTWVLKNYRKK